MHFGQVLLPEGVDAALVAPKGPGHLVRAEFEKGAGVPSLIAFWPGASDSARQLALAYAKGIGGARGGVFHRSIGRKSKSGLVGRQGGLCRSGRPPAPAAPPTPSPPGYHPPAPSLPTSP